MRLLQKLNDYFKIGNNLSSDRLNRFLVLVNYLPIGFAVAFNIVYGTLTTGVSWEPLSYFMGSLAVFYSTLFATKALTQSQENKKPKSNETDSD